MNDGAVIVFHPGRVNFANLARAVAAGDNQMPVGGQFQVDMRDSPECNTAVVCLLIELLRIGSAKGCRLEIVHPSPQLISLINLYRLGALLLPSSAA